jgi:2'-5' RNA ligase
MTARKVGCDRQHFVPHVTIARTTQARLAASNIEPIRWRCESFALMRSALGGQGAAYESVARWKLATRPVAEVGQLSLL